MIPHGFMQGIPNKMSSLQQNQQNNCLTIIKNNQRWAVPPSHLKISMPFVKAFPIKPLGNDIMEYEILTERGKQYMSLPIRQTFEISSKANTYDDMCEMNVLNEPEVLNNLVQRYKHDYIFTYIGPTLIIINPYKVVKKNFQHQTILEIRDKIMNNEQDKHPHVYLTAGKAYKQMLSSEYRQAIVISGESGAGKTQSTKYCMQILTSLSHKKIHAIQQKILACNPILEAFGNSKTVRNDNSSRFGKYVQIFFGDDQTIKGANIKSYLLQKSRVVSVAKNERSFHVFYALTSSGQYEIEEPSYYKYLKQSGCYKASSIDDKKYFQQINESMNQIGFSQKDRGTIWKLIKAILQIGNIQFDDKNNCVNQSLRCQIINKQMLKAISEALSIQDKQLQKMLLFQKKKFLKQFTLSPYKKNSCISNRETLSKSIYNVIFEFILHKIQNSLHPDQKYGKHYKSINILDIFGFQNFEQNSFQQLCINYTNQKLLKLYNKYIFEREMELLKEDGLVQQIGNIRPHTNDVIELINGKLSIFSLINDFTLQKQYKDEDIANGFSKLSKSNLIKFNKHNKMQFAIVHSQCQVNYKVEGFKNKNLDKINLDIQEVVTNLLLNKNKEQVGKTLLSKFNSEIQNLLTELTTSNVHFIRCIKPNETKTPNSPDQAYILNQIRYLGVFQTIQIRKKTFPSRKTYEQFANQYRILFPNINGIDKNVTQQILKTLNCKNTEYLLGNKRVYVNQQIQEMLNKLIYKHLKIKNQKVKKVQEVLRRFSMRKKIDNNLKTLVKRKQIWKKIAQKAKYQLLKQSFGLMKQFNHKKLQQIRNITLAKNHDYKFYKSLQQVINEFQTINKGSVQVQVQVQNQQQELAKINIMQTQKPVIKYSFLQIQNEDIQNKRHAIKIIQEARLKLYQCYSKQIDQYDALRKDAVYLKQMNEQIKLQVQGNKLQIQKISLQRAQLAKQLENIQKQIKQHEIIYQSKSRYAKNSNKLEEDYTALIDRNALLQIKIIQLKNFYQNNQKVTKTKGQTQKINSQLKKMHSEWIIIQSKKQNLSKEQNQQNQQNEQKLPPLHKQNYEIAKSSINLLYNLDKNNLQKNLVLQVKVNLNKQIQKLKTEYQEWNTKVTHLQQKFRIEEQIHGQKLQKKYDQLYHVYDEKNKSLQSQYNELLNNLKKQKESILYLEATKNELLTQIQKLKQSMQKYKTAVEECQYVSMLKQTKERHKKIMNETTTLDIALQTNILI